ncbi:hypothetical protein HanPSC8_Chr10g0415421 [Helianthus annuus]|nr:hypothetical protein HanPSC8_Chr10g0415421 [Helianthus annuus]
MLFPLCSRKTTHVIGTRDLSVRNQQSYGLISWSKGPIILSRPGPKFVLTFSETALGKDIPNIRNRKKILATNNHPY